MEEIEAVPLMDGMVIMFFMSRREYYSFIIK